MDMLPINPVSTNRVDASINLTNDGGSKSNTGYINQRGGEPEKTKESFDEVQLSHHHNNIEEQINQDDNLINIIKRIINKIKDFILKTLGLKKETIPNIFEKHE